MRQALIMLRRQPGFTLLAAGTLALGLGASAAMFSLAYAVFLRPLPFRDAGRVTTFVHRFGRSTTAVSLPTVVDYRNTLTTFEAFAVSRPLDANLTGGGEPERVRALEVSADFFRVFELAPALGRTFLPHEDQPGAERVALVSDALWKRRLGRAPGVLGTQLALNGQTFTIVGVMPPGFGWGRAYGNDRAADVWLPFTLTAARLDPANRGWEYLDVSARLAPGATVARAQAEVDVLAARLRQQYPQQYPADAHWTVTLNPLRDELMSPSRRPVLALVVSVVLLLVIACTNVAGLFLFRTAARRRELAIRQALGASRGRLFAQALAEALVVALCAAAAGGLLAAWLTSAAAGLLPFTIPGGPPSVRDTPVLLVMAGVAGACALLIALSGLGTRERPMSEGLRESRTSQGTVRARLRAGLVTGQIALSTLLLAGAGLLAHSMARLLRVDPGFESAGVLVGEVALPRTKYAQDWQLTAFFESLVARTAATPGVRSAAVVSVLPLGDTNNAGTFDIEGRSTAPGEKLPHAQSWVASAGYFATLHVPLRRGRLLQDSDTAAAPGVVVINEEMARRYWPGEDPLGRRIDLQGEPNRRWLEIVGVVGDVRHRAIDEPATPQYYLPVAQGPERHMYLVARTDGDPLALAPALRSIVRAQDSEQPVFGVATMDEVLSRSVAERRALVTLLAGFAVAALLLSCIGVFGLLAQSVTQRRGEFAVRLAVGATPARIVSLVLTGALRMAAVGVTAGLLLAGGAARLMGSLLYEVKPLDPATYLGVAAVLAATLLLASAIPARRAATVDPTSMLK